jgi:hypothetical protein
MKNDRRGYDLRVDSIIRSRVKEPQLTELAQEVLLTIDDLLTSPVVDTAHKITRMSVVVDSQGEAVPIKLVLARGSSRDTVHLTVPRPLRPDSIPCEACSAVGWSDLSSHTLCEVCFGLGSVDQVVEPSPSL